MATLVTRSGKGSPLTHDEVDANFNNLNTDKVESLSDLSITATSTELNYVSGVTSGIQTQISSIDASKLNLSGGTMTGDLSATNISVTGTVDGRDIAVNIPAELGTAGQVLTVNTGATAAEWADASGGSSGLGTLTKSFASGETATITLSSTVSPTAVVAVTKEVGQTGVSSKGAWDVASDAANYELYNEAPATSLTLEGWDISAAHFLHSFSVTSEESLPGGLFIKPDGLKMYIVGFSGDEVNEYSLSTAWDTSTASFIQTFSVAAQDTVPGGIFFKPDGTKMYVVGSSNDSVYEYNLSTAWDVSTASYSQNFSVAAQEVSPTGLFFKPDGTKMYVVGATGDDVNEYNLSTAWDVSTASYSQSFSVAAQELSPSGLAFKPDGIKMYVLGQTGDAVYEYTLSAAWDISTASYDQNFSVAAQDTSPAGLFFKPDGAKMYVVGTSGDAVYEFGLLKATLGTGSFSSSDLGKRIFVDDGGDAVLITTDGSCFLVSEFGASTYTSGNWSLSGLDVDATNGITLSEYSTAWDVSQASYLQSLSLIQTVPYGIFFKPDGTRLYIIGGTSDDIDQYDLTTAWDISTASTNGRFVVSQDTNPKDLFFKPDGLKMYVIGSTQDDVFEYSLSTAWDVTSASYFQNLPITETNPEGLFFKPDGTKMYTIGLAGSDDIDEYNLSTAWDITTASLLQSFAVGATPTGMFFRKDGLKAFITQQSGNDRVSEYNLTTAWDVSTLVLAQSFDVSDEDDSAQGVFFHPLGNKMYIVGASNDSVYEYDVGTILQPIAQYLPSVTNVGGQIDSTYWTDINSMNADDTDNDGEVYYAVSTDDRTTWSIAKASDGVRNIVRNNGGTWEYNSNATYGSETWASATTNNEFAAIAQAMTVAANQMDKTQIDAVADGSHFTLGDTLDLAIVPYLASTGLAPTSDGLSINYDAAALNKGAILGTDYDYDVPAGDVVRITSLSTQNLKVRIV